MGRLVIAHHKSYHPYRRDNIEKVRKDEEEAAQAEAKAEGRMMLADSEARIDLLRERSGSSKKKKRNEDEFVAAARKIEAAETLPTSGGHINFFEDLEQNAIASAVRVTKKSAAEELEKGLPLAPSAKDLNPWYSSRSDAPVEIDSKQKAKRQRDEMRKSIHDPMTFVTKQLTISSESSSSSRMRRPPLPPPGVTSQASERFTRESSERQRALALIEKRKREISGSATPTTDRGASEYGDQYNRREVEAAHRDRERRDPRDRGWRR